MRSNITSCLAVIAHHEGGYVNHPKDPGGATMKGITQRVYDGWRVLNGLDKRPVKQILDSEVEAIYRRQYWDGVRGDHLPMGVDLSVFDYAVNSGVARSAKTLQRALGTKPDGFIGMVTLARAKETPAVNVINAICDDRLAFLKSLKTWGTFGKGWARRVSETRAAALKMAKAGA
jgi:lysozyme family protein